MRLILVLILLTGVAHAYPQFQLAMGVDRCTACHLSPAGGGLLNDYGHDEAGSTISRDGDGRFLHGAWTPPSWIQLGGDFRGAAAFKANEGTNEWLAFPMQADVNVRVGGERFSVMATVGLRGTAREPRPALIERFASREHYVMYQGESSNYVRAGRFFPVFGIRSQDHTAFVRRYLGFHTLEEPYGVAGGVSGDTWEVHAGAFVPRPSEFLGSGVKATGATAYVEKRVFEDTTAIALQARYASSDADARALLGVVGKRWFPGAEVLLLGELDLQRQSFDGAGPTRYQVAAYAGASKMIARGWMLGAALHRWQPDVRQHTMRDAVEVNLQLFLLAHFEVHALTRITGAGSFDEPAMLSFLQLHYYL